MSTRCEICGGSADQCFAASGSGRCASETLGSSTSATLRRMVDDVGDTAIVEQFVADYLRLLDLRIESLRRQLSGSDFDAASISLLTLKSSSDMVGGGEVAMAARQLRYAVDHRQGEDIAVLLDRLLTSVSVLAGELADVELRPRPTPHPVAE